MTPQDSLPRLMRGAGYDTRFISGFNLDFPGLQPWLVAMGFERIEGQEAPFFAGRAPVRYHFDSVPDELLLERVLHELSQPRDKPLFVTTFTQSTHQPYIDPSTGVRTQQAAFGYVLSQPRVTPECIYTLRAYNPNRVYAHCGQTEVVVELDGDDTRTTAAPSALQQRVLETVNRLRLGRGFE